MSLDKSIIYNNTNSISPNSSRINTNWFCLDEDKKEEEYIIETQLNNNYIENQIELTKRVEKCEQTLKSIESILEDLKSKIETFSKEDEEIKKHIQEIYSKVRANETACNVIRNENLKLINRILEAEISVERTTNILLRKNISFPFTKINL